MWKFLVILQTVYFFNTICLAQSPTLEAGFCETCISKIKTLEKLNIQQNIDEKFIKLSSGKIFNYKRPDKADGEPNCVAAALRAGGYLPAFVLSGTDDFYDNVLPDCFKKLDSSEKAKKGDIGITYMPKIPTLAHVYLFIDSQTIFEKAGPQNTEAFVVLPYPHLSASLAKEKSNGDVRREVWRFNPQKSCVLNQIKAKFDSLSDNSLEKKMSKEIDRRIYSGDWRSPITAFSKKDVLAFKRNKEEEIKNWFLSLPGGFKKDRDYKVWLEKSFTLNLVKTVERTPMFE